MKSNNEDNQFLYDTISSGQYKRVNLVETLKNKNASHHDVSYFLIQFDALHWGLCPGQISAFYQNEICLGGGKLHMIGMRTM
jgi:tRNA U34 2-thiouridine synthase MnmA/TrmU